MIKQLKKKIILTSMLSFLTVMVILSTIVNVANYLIITSSLDDTLKLIYDNNGTLPLSRGHKNSNDRHLDSIFSRSIFSNDSATENPKTSEVKHKTKNSYSSGNGVFGILFTKETPYSTRYFTLHLNNNGKLSKSKLDKIVSVTADTINTYSRFAYNHGVGSGYYKEYRFLVANEDTDGYIAIFIEASKELSQFHLIAFWSFVAIIICAALIALLTALICPIIIKSIMHSSVRQKQFITNATHELKTPLTVINTSLSVLQMEVGEQKWIDKAKNQTAKMSVLINELIMLSRLDEEEFSIKKELFCISDVVEEIADSFKFAAANEGYSFQYDIIPDIQYNGEKSYIYRLINILLDNALKYSLPESEISLSLSYKHHSVIINQSNSCEPMDDLVLSELFERFYRPDSSRKSETEGHGIGLSMAKSIVEAHGGTIKAECPSENRIFFTVMLPTQK